MKIVLFTLFILTTINTFCATAEKELSLGGLPSMVKVNEGPERRYFQEAARAQSEGRPGVYAFLTKNSPISDFNLTLGKLDPRYSHPNKVTMPLLLLPGYYNV